MHVINKMRRIYSTNFFISLYIEIFLNEGQNYYSISVSVVVVYVKCIKKVPHQSLNKLSNSKM